MHCSGPAVEAARLTLRVRLLLIVCFMATGCQQSVPQLAKPVIPIIYDAVNTSQCSRTVQQDNNPMTPHLGMVGGGGSRS